MGNILKNPSHNFLVFKYNHGENLKASRLIAPKSADFKSEEITAISRQLAAAAPPEAYEKLASAVRQAQAELAAAQDHRSNLVEAQTHTLYQHLRRLAKMLGRTRCRNPGRWKHYYPAFCSIT